MKTHTRWVVKLRPGETREARNGTRVTNLGPTEIHVAIEAPLAQPDQPPSASHSSANTQHGDTRQHEQESDDSGT